MSETTDTPRFPAASPLFVPSPVAAPNSQAWPSHSAGSWEAQNAASNAIDNPAPSPTMPPFHPHANPYHSNSYTFWNDLNEETSGGDGGKQPAENPHGGDGRPHPGWANEREDGHGTDGGRHPGFAEGADNDRGYYEGDDRYGDGYDGGWGGTAVVPPSGYGSYHDGKTPFDRGEWDNDDPVAYPPKYSNDRGVRPGGIPAIRFKRGEGTEERGSKGALIAWIGVGVACVVLPFFFAWHRRRRNRRAATENARLERNERPAEGDVGLDSERLLQILTATTVQVQESDLIQNEESPSRKRGRRRGSLRLSRTESRGSLRLNLSSVSLTALAEGDIETGDASPGQCGKSNSLTKRSSHSTAPVSELEDEPEPLEECTETDVGLDIDSDDGQRGPELAGECCDAAIALEECSETEKDLESGRGKESEPEVSRESVDGATKSEDGAATTEDDQHDGPSCNGDPPSTSQDNPVTSLYVLDEPGDYEEDSRYSALSLPCSNASALAPTDETAKQEEQIQQRVVPNTCAICLVQYKPGCHVTWSPNSECTHVFHRECVLMWLQKKEEPLCPCCRREFVPKSALQDEGGEGGVDGDNEGESGTREDG